MGVRKLNLWSADGRANTQLKMGLLKPVHKNWDFEKLHPVKT